MANVYYEKDADPSLVASRKVAIIGYGSQGHAHALNLKDSGVDVRVGLREGSSSKAKAEAAGLRVVPIDQAAAEADLVMMLLPDTEQRDVYEQSIAPNLNGGDALFFAHGFNIRFDQIKPRRGVDVAMVAPEGPGSPRAPHLHRGRRRALPHRGRAGRERQGQGRSRSSYADAHRRHPCRRARDDVRGGDRDRSLRRAGRAVRRPHRRSCRPASRRSSRRATSPSRRTSSACTS